MKRAKLEPKAPTVSKTTTLRVPSKPTARTTKVATKATTKAATTKPSSKPKTATAGGRSVTAASGKDKETKPGAGGKQKRAPWDLKGRLQVRNGTFCGSILTPSLSVESVQLFCHWVSSGTVDKSIQLVGGPGFNHQPHHIHVHFFFLKTLSLYIGTFLESMGSSHITKDFKLENSIMLVDR